jgi:integrase/recombinase XerC
MTPMTVQSAVQRYLQERRALGFDLRISGQLLLHFARFADAREHHGPLTRDLQLAWARDQARGADAITWARRVEILRPFAKYYQQVEPQTAVLDSTTFGRAHRRLTPHIYTDHEIADLLDEAGRLRPAGLRPATYQTLFGLIAAAGLRLSEALHLRDTDVDVHGGVLTVHQTKFKKSRVLPIHPSTVSALGRYRRVRDHMMVRAADSPFFVGAAGRALPAPTVHHIFGELRRKLAWVSRGGHPHPRIHDLRHTFAVRRVQRWQESAVPMDQGMFWLSTYLGHATISNTYWYLTGVPDLLAVVGTRFERFAFGSAEVVDA